MATFDSQTYNGRYIRLTVTESNVDPINNTSIVNWNVTVYGSSGNWYSSTVYLAINGSELVNTSWIDPPQGYFPMVNGTTKSGSLVVSHGSDGKKTVPITFNTAIYYRAAESHGGTFTLTNIDRTAPTVTQADISSIDTNSFTISATSDVDCNSWEYSLNNGSSWTVFSTTSATSASTSVTGLQMNTDYSVLIRAKKTSNGVYGTSGTKTAKTLGSSTITSASNVTLGNNCAVTWTPLDVTFKYKLAFVLGGFAHTTDFITPNQLTAYTYTGYTIPLSVANQIPNSTTGGMTVILTTYLSDGTQIGGQSSKGFTVTVPSSVVPTITSVTLAEGTHSGYNLYVKSLSTIKATTVAAGAYNSTIASIVTKFGDLSYMANSQGVATSDVLQVAGSMIVETTVTDSRGRTATNTQTVTVYDYFRPTIAIDIAINGTTVVTMVNGNIAPVNNTNAKSLVVTRKRLSDDTTTTHTVSPLANYAYTDVWTQTVADIGVESYEYTAVVTDTKQSVSIVKMTAVICISRLAGGRGVTFFTEASKEGFWVWNIRHDVTAAEYLDIARMLAEPYDNTADYYVGQFCTNNSKVWECNTAITGGETWTASHWTELGNVS